MDTVLRHIANDLSAGQPTPKILRTLEFKKAFLRLDASQVVMMMMMMMMMMMTNKQ